VNSGNIILIFFLWHIPFDPFFCKVTQYCFVGIFTVKFRNVLIKFAMSVFLYLLVTTAEWLKRFSLTLVLRSSATIYQQIPFLFTSDSNNTHSLEDLIRGSQPAVCQCVLCVLCTNSIVSTYVMKNIIGIWQYLLLWAAVSLKNCDVSYWWTL
jgi:hypothetical protein